MNSNSLKQIQDDLKPALNKVIKYDDKEPKIQSGFPGYNCTSGFTVYDLMMQFFDDTDLQQKVYLKLIEYTKETTLYISGEHLKPKHFHSFLPTLKNFVTNGFREKEKEEKSDYDEELSEAKFIGYIVNFALDFEEYEISDIWAVTIIELFGNYLVDTPGSLYQYQDIFFSSIAGEETIKTYGIDGFIAALLLFCHWDIIGEKPKSLQEITIDHFAKLTSACKTQDELIEWVKKIPEDTRNSSHFRSKLSKELQVLLFLEYDDGDGYILIYNGDLEIISRKWYKYVFGKFIVKTIELTTECITRTIIFNKDLEEVGFKDTSFEKKERSLITQEEQQELNDKLNALFETL